MTHTIEAGMPTAKRRRRRRTAITLIVVALLLVVALWKSWDYVQGWLGKPDTTAHACLPVKDVVASQVTLNVYNATARSGLAGSTAAGLKKRGFKIASIANDPLEKKVTGTAEIRYGTGGVSAAKLVAAQLKSPRMVKDSRSDSSLDVVVGNKFTALAPPVKVKKGAPRTTAVVTSATTC